MMRNNTAVMSFKSLDGIPSFIAIATQALYTIAPITTLEVTRKNVAFFKQADSDNNARQSDNHCSGSH